MKQDKNTALPQKSSGSWMEPFMKLFPFAGLALVVIGFSIFSGGTTLTLTNITKIFEQSFSLMIVAVAAVFLLSQDCLDMSIGATIGMAGAVAAYASKTSVPLALISAIAVGLVIGAVNGTMHGILGVNAMIATLAMQFILRGLLLIVCNSGTVGIAVGMYALDEVWLKLTICIVFITVCFLLFQYHSFGKKCRAIGAGQDATIQSGINVRKSKVLGYMLMGACSGFAGFFTVIRTGAAMYNTGNMVEFNVLIALILGGMPINGGAESRIRSAIIGVLILSVMDNGMVILGMGTYTQLITKGLIFIFVLAMTFTIRYRINSKKGIRTV